LRRIAMRKLVIGLLLLVTLLTGCVATNSSNQTTTVPTSTTNYTLTAGFGVLTDVQIDKAYPGWSGSAPLTIINGGDGNRSFTIVLTSVVNPREGYEALPLQYLSWFTVSEPSVVVPAGVTYQVPIIIAIPANNTYTGRNAELGFLVSEQGKLVQVAYEAEWFINTTD